MNRVYRELEIQSPEDFKYFENMADLMESEEHFTEEEVADFLKDLDKAAFADLLGQYFEHVQNWIPDRETDFYTLMENIHQVMAGYLLQLEMEAEGEEDALPDLADEIVKFRRWYLLQDSVVCTNDATGESHLAPVIDALAYAGAEKLGEDSYHFDFSRTLDYELDRLTVLLS